MHIKKELGVKTSLGISNVSFGLPNRDIVNSVFFAHALQNGLDAVIMNPFSEAMQNVYYAHNALCGIDESCQEYIGYASQNVISNVAQVPQDLTLKRAIIKGMKKEAKEISKALVATSKPLDIINEHIVPALDDVGKDYENGTVFLPQLLMSAETATIAFEVIKEYFASEESTSYGEVIIATVKGDIHDIGKNIVKVILQNYGYTVHDLGKDVAPETIVEYAKDKGIKLVGLSALMTTTVVAMEDTIKLLNKELSDVKVFVGGAVLTPEYAQMIGADKYCKDAMEAVRYAQEFFK